MKNKAYILMGASGSGKDTLGKYFKEKGIPKLISNTSRPMREGEEDGVDYYFRTKEEIESIDLINFQEYSGNVYGYSKETVKAMSHSNRSFYCCATVSALYSLKKFLPDYEVIGVYLDSDEEIQEKRMRERGDSEEAIQSRLKFLSINKDLEIKAKYHSSWIIHKKSTLDDYKRFVDTVVKDKEKTKVYISGRMTGTKDHGREKFGKVKEILLEMGFEVFSPSDIGRIDGLNWSDYMKYDIAEMTKCDFICMLDDWEDSKGATIEHNLAKSLGMPIKYLNKYGGFKDDENPIS